MAGRRSVRQSEEVGGGRGHRPQGHEGAGIYERFGFQALDESRLFIPMRELVAREAREWKA
jgi:hypothetical protein